MLSIPKSGRSLNNFPESNCIWYSGGGGGGGGGGVGGGGGCP